MVFDPRDREALMAGSSCPPSNINLWPSAPLDFCKYLYEYNDGILEFSKRFIRVVALALEVEETYFDNMISPISGLSPLHYPPNTGIPKPPGRSVHTDYSCKIFFFYDWFETFTEPNGRVHGSQSANFHHVARGAERQWTFHRCSTNPKYPRSQRGRFSRARNQSRLF